MSALLLSFIAAVIGALCPAARLDATWVGAPAGHTSAVRYVGGESVDGHGSTTWAGGEQVVVFVHGGGWVGGDRLEMPGWLVGFQDAGWTVVSIDYTLGDLEQATADVIARVAQVRADLTPARLVVAGWSAGAHLILAALADGMPVDGVVLAGTPFAPDDYLAVSCGRDHPPMYLIYGMQDEVTSWVDNRPHVEVCGSRGPTMVALVDGGHDPSAGVNVASIVEFVRGVR